MRNRYKHSWTNINPEKLIKVSMWIGYLYSITCLKYIALIINILGGKEILLLFCDTKTLNLSNERWKIDYLEQYLPRKKPKALYEKDVHTIQ